MVPALFITADKDNESGNKTGTKLRAELSLGNAVPACCRILRARRHARTHTQLPTTAGAKAREGGRGVERRPGMLRSKAALRSLTA